MPSGLDRYILAHAACLKKSTQAFHLQEISQLWLAIASSYQLLIDREVKLRDNGNGHLLR